MREQSTPLEVFLSPVEVFFGESIHSPDFSMNWRRDSFDKILYVLRGKTTLYLENSESVVATSGTFLLVENGVQHRLHDSNHSTILLLCLGQKWMAREKEIGALWRLLHKQKGNSVQTSLSTQKRIEKLWRKCLFEQHSIAPGVPETLKACILLLMVDLLRENAPARSLKSSDRISRFWKSVQENPYESWDVQTAADHCKLSRRQFTTRFKQVFHQTFIEALTVHRMIEFKKMCLTENRSISEAAFACGFEDLSHFYRLFKRQFKLSPGLWLERNRPKRKSTLPRSPRL